MLKVGVYRQGRRQKTFQGGPMKNQDREIAPINLLLLYQSCVMGRTGHFRAHLKGTLHQQLCVKIEKLF